MTDYTTILALRGETNAQRRGYLFEQAIREILPWSFRPPLAVNAETEQFDAFFEWNGWHFLVEMKAKEDPIRAGSHDWEDFELKILKRSGICIGLFFSLWNLNEKVYARASYLNEQRCTTIVIAGDTWEQLAANNLDLEEFIRYMVFYGRATFASQVPDLNKVRRWTLDRDAIMKQVGQLSQAHSATFLRRHKLSRHGQVYLGRDIDKDIRDMAASLRPSRLSHDKRQHRRGDTSVEVRRARPDQVALIKDLSGSGKTTLSVELALERDRFFGMSKAALEADIDKLDDLLLRIAKDRGVRALTAVDKPIVYVIDSLDEASTVPQKRKEVRSLFEALRTLNEVAEEFGLIAFPILLVFTVRHDLWREWESYFEGRRAREFVRRFSIFSPIEAKEALDRYSKAYEFQIEGELDSDTSLILSHPFSLQVFSEAHEYVGRVEATKLVSHNALALYFERKKEDLLKRPIPGFQGDIILNVCSEIAMAMVDAHKNDAARSLVAEIIAGKYPILTGFSEAITNSLVSEQILVRDADNSTNVRFRHIRFIEYLVAYHVAFNLNKFKQTEDRRLWKTGRKATDKGEVLENFTKRIFQSNFLSIYYIHDFIKSIATSVFPNIQSMLSDYYAADNEYMRRLLSSRRLDIAEGKTTDEGDIGTIQLSMISRDVDLCWDAFFVLAARPNRQGQPRILQAFEVAWDCTKQRPDRWKLLTKLRWHGLILHEAVVTRIVNSRHPKEWEVYFEELDGTSDLTRFPSVWKSMSGDRLLASMKTKSDWGTVVKLISFAAQGQKYPRGQREA